MPAKLSREQFIVNANKRHNNFYDYTKSVYVSTHKKVIITCKLHGDFEQTPANHCYGQRCPDCGDIVKSTKKTKSNTKFIKECIAIHGNVYDYSKTQYTGSFKKIIVICQKHGEYTCIAHDHIRGKGCRQCAHIKRIASQTYDTEKFIKLSNKRHNNLYDYSKAIYTGAYNKVEIICSLHGSFMQQASIHYGKMGCGCPACFSGESYKLESIDLILGKSVREKTFSGCKDINKLRFDRYVKSKNILLEYDGEQHFRINKAWKDSLDGIKRRDRIKTTYAVSNGYNFIRIKYTEDHIAVLESFLELVKNNPDKQIVQIYGTVHMLDK